MFLLLNSFITVVYTEQVPSGGPPSFSGRLAKCSYKLTIGTQKPGCAAKITRLPFRVMVIPGKWMVELIVKTVSRQRLHVYHVSLSCVYCSPLSTRVSSVDGYLPWISCDLPYDCLP